MNAAEPAKMARETSPPVQQLPRPADDLEARLDEALRQTFPASDPTAVSAPR